MISFIFILYLFLTRHVLKVHPTFRVYEDRLWNVHLKAMIPNALSKFNKERRDVLRRVNHDTVPDEHWTIFRGQYDPIKNSYYLINVRRFLVFSTKNFFISWILGCCIIKNFFQESQRKASSCIFGEKSYSKRLDFEAKI